MISSTALFTEIQNGPLSAALAEPLAAGNDGAIAEALNAPYTTITSTISRALFALWAAQTGMRSAIRDHVLNTESPLRSIAISLEDFLGGASETLDFAKSENQAMLAAWVTAGGCTQAQADSLLALCQQPVSRAQHAFGESVTIEQIAQALRG
jgi:hypothetical protein